MYQYNYRPGIYDRTQLSKVHTTSETPSRTLTTLVL